MTLTLLGQPPHVTYVLEKHETLPTPVVQEEKGGRRMGQAQLVEPYPLCDSGFITAHSGGLGYVMSPEGSPVISWIR